MVYDSVYEANKYFRVPTIPVLAPTLESDFSSSAGWSQQGTEIAINTGTGKLDWIGLRSSTNTGISYDFGAGIISTSKWRLEFDLYIQNFSGSSYTQRFGWMLSTKGSADDSDQLRDFIGGRVSYRGQAPTSYQEFNTIDDQGSTDTWADNPPDQPAHGTDAGVTPVAGTTYNIVLTRDSPTAYTMTISSGGTLLDTLNYTSYAGTSDLRYLLIQRYGDGASAGSSFNGTIDNLKFYNGVTTATPAKWINPVCSGTISSTATMGSNGDFDVSYTTVASKTGSGQRGCNAWKFIGQSASPYTGRNAVKGATNSDFSVSSSTAFTIAAWVKLNTLGQQHTILGYSGAYTNTFWTNLGISAANKVEGHTATNGISNNFIPTGNSLSVDTWHHCVFIHKADKTVTVYLDADTANKGTGTGDTGSASAGFWTIAGRWGYNVTIPTLPFLDGFIDQATLWDVALSEADVTTLYNGGRKMIPSVSQNNIKGYWTFNETTGAAENKAV